MTLKNNRAPLLCYFKLCASFHSNRPIQTVVTVQKHQIRVKISDFLPRMTLTFDRWPWKIRGHLSYATSSFVHHFMAIGHFKLEFQSGNTKFGSKSAFFVPCDLDIWQMTLENNRAPHLTYFKLCASLHSHRSFQTAVTLRKRQIQATVIVCPMWPWNLTDDLEKQYGTSSMLLQAVCMISLPHVNSNWSYSPETAKLDVDLCDLDLWHWPFAWTSLLAMVITPENFMMIWWWKHSEKGLTDRWTDWTNHRAAWLQLKIHLKTLSAKWRPFCPGGDELIC